MEIKKKFYKHIFVSCRWLLTAKIKIIKPSVGSLTCLNEWNLKWKGNSKHKIFQHFFIRKQAPPKSVMELSTPHMSYDCNKLHFWGQLFCFVVWARCSLLVFYQSWRALYYLCPTCMLSHIPLCQRDEQLQGLRKLNKR